MIPIHLARDGLALCGGDTHREGWSVDYEDVECVECLRLEIDQRADVKAENERLRAELAKWTGAAGAGHRIPCDLGPLCPYCEIERLRARGGGVMGAPIMALTKGYVELSLQEAERAGNEQQVRLLRSWLEAQEDAVTLSLAGRRKDAEIERLRSEKEVALQSKDRHKARAQYVEAENKRLQAALMHYGRHTSSCDARIGDEEGCTCGLLRAMRGGVE